MTHFALFTFTPPRHLKRPHFAVISLPENRSFSSETFPLNPQNRETFGEYPIPIALSLSDREIARAMANESGFFARLSFVVLRYLYI